MVGNDREVVEDVDVRDALVKAWRRRAEASEGREKWEEGGTGSRLLAQNGHRRMYVERACVGLGGASGC